MIHFFTKVKSKYFLVVSDFKTAEKKFLDQGIDKPLVKDYLSKFKDLRDKNKLKDSDKNIDLWAKKPFKDFKSFVDKLSKAKTKTEVKKEARVEGAKLIAENDGWRVYEITSHKAAMLYGANTKWCITEKDGEHYQAYSRENNIYYLISKTLNPKENSWAKIALLVSRKGKKNYWDVLDKEHSSVPENLEIPTFKDEVPKYIFIDGKRYEDFNNLPKNLEVSGDLYLTDTRIKSLPDGLEVGGDLYLWGTNIITSLPEGLKVGGDLYLRGTNITSLPEGLKVGGDLSLGDTKITSLPAGLKVGGNLGLYTQITSLSAGLKVGGYLDLTGTPITSLPAGLKVGGWLSLRGTKITSLSEGLKVGGWLNLIDTPITSLPHGLKVGGRIYVNNPETIKCSEELRRKLSRW